MRCSFRRLGQSEKSPYLCRYSLDMGSCPQLILSVSKLLKPSPCAVVPSLTDRERQGRICRCAPPPALSSPTRCSAALLCPTPPLTVPRYPILHCGICHSHASVHRASIASLRCH